MVSTVYQGENGVSILNGWDWDRMYATCVGVGRCPSYLCRSWRVHLIGARERESSILPGWA